MSVSLTLATYTIFGVLCSLVYFFCALRPKVAVVDSAVATEWFSLLLALCPILFNLLQRLSPPLSPQ